jgi:hypothetical protein
LWLVVFALYVICLVVTRVPLPAHESSLSQFNTTILTPRPRHLASDTLGYAIKRNPGQPLQALNLSARLTVPLTWNEEDKPELIRAPPHCATQVPCRKEREINHFGRTKKGGQGEDKGEKVNLHGHPATCFMHVLGGLGRLVLQLKSIQAVAGLSNCRQMPFHLLVSLPRM